VLDFIHYLGEELVKNEENKSDEALGLISPTFGSQNSNRRRDSGMEVWAVAGILYHICTNFDPQDGFFHRSFKGRFPEPLGRW